MKKDWSERYMTLPCNKCKWYWTDVKYCTTYKILVFEEEFDINMCELNKNDGRKMYE